ncbi:NADPH dehydrogenase [Neohortaea acidophila]|uniref:NADPH dehydrogenase n=1 Tax=Neohortaea acidophila TaxID=245834 RepID=A0A6A6Q6V3_9PEZI|nr:NADPH dehydrogenase [Neohortaea acidophila]KAF2487696.1 NADPH dehydrogenase [Neohortaea acidophila]
MAKQDRLFSPIKLGPATLSHRIVLAPLTRLRADKNHVQMDMCAEYYAQRASTPGTLLIAEATIVSPRAGGMDNVPGIWSTEHIAAWRKVTDAVHAKGSFIFLQLWDLGRRASPEVLAREQDGPHRVCGPSAIEVDGAPSAKYHALTVDEIQSRIQDFARGARNAMSAGFDGVELHAANGYLVDSFLQECCNQRSDEYGGSIEGRSRFCIDVIKALVDAVGDPRKVALRLSPWTFQQDNTPQTPISQFEHVITELKDLGLAYLHLVESRTSGDPTNATYHRLTRRNDSLIEIWCSGKSPIILAGGFDYETATVATSQIYADKQMLVAIGRHYIANPDLVFRFKHRLPIIPYDRSTFYKAVSKDGYTDYPYSTEYQAAAKAGTVN